MLNAFQRSNASLHGSDPGESPPGLSPCRTGSVLISAAFCCVTHTDEERTHQELQAMRQAAVEVVYVPVVRLRSVSSFSDGQKLRWLTRDESVHVSGPAPPHGREPDWSLTGLQWITGLAWK